VRPTRARASPILHSLFNAARDAFIFTCDFLRCTLRSGIVGVAACSYSTAPLDWSWPWLSSSLLMKWFRWRASDFCAGYRSDAPFARCDALGKRSPPGRDVGDTLVGLLPSGGKKPTAGISRVLASSRSDPNAWTKAPMPRLNARSHTSVWISAEQDIPSIQAAYRTRAPYAIG
jgi:hypothetical protein